MQELGFDLESELQGVSPEIEVECEVWIPPVKKTSKPLRFVTVWERPDAETAKELRDALAAKEIAAQSAAEKIVEYQGYLKNLGDGKEANEVDFQKAMDESQDAVADFNDWLKDQVEERIISIKKLPLKNGKKVEIPSGEMPEALQTFFKWEHYIDGLSAAFRKTLDKNTHKDAKIKNSRR